MTATAGAESGKTARKSGAVGGGIWTAAERIISQASQLIIFVFAARMLGPEEFGVFALVSACAILLMRVAEGGWAPYIMSWHGDIELPRQVLLIAILSGGVAATLGVLAGVGLLEFGHEAQIGALVILFSVWVLLAVTSAAQKGIMIWQGKLRASAFTEIAGEMVGLIVALASLWSGLGVLSLVFGRLAFQSVQLVLATVTTRALPLGGLRGKLFRDMMVMSGQLFAARMMFNLRVYAATFMVGAFLGPAAVGFYRAADRLVGALTEVITVPAQALAWNLFRKAREAHGGTTEGFQALATVFFLTLIGVAMPLFLWLIIMGEDLILGLLGPEWLPALPVVVILAVGRGVMLPGAITEPLLSLAGEIRRLPPASLFYLVLTLLLVLIFAPMGLIPLSLSQLLVGLVIAVTNGWLMYRYCAVNWRDTALNAPRLLGPILLGTACLLVLRDASFASEWPALLRAVGLSLPAVVVYLAALMALQPKMRAWVRQRVQQRRKTAGGI